VSQVIKLLFLSSLILSSTAFAGKLSDVKSLSFHDVMTHPRRTANQWGDLYQNGSEKEVVTNMSKPFCLISSNFLRAPDYGHTISGELDVISYKVDNTFRRVRYELQDQKRESYILKCYNTQTSEDIKSVFRDKVQL
jgi:hypothetical protein